jgi:hypothetical protein
MGGHRQRIIRVGAWDTVKDEPILPGWEWEQENQCIRAGHSVTCRMVSANGWSVDELRGVYLYLAGRRVDVERDLAGVIEKQRQKRDDESPTMAALVERLDMLELEGNMASEAQGLAFNALVERLNNYRVEMVQTGRAWADELAAISEQIEAIERLFDQRDVARQAMVAGDEDDGIRTEAPGCDRPGCNYYGYTAEQARRDDDGEPAPDAEFLDPYYEPAPESERCPVVSTAYGDLPVGTRFRVPSGRLRGSAIWVLEVDGWRLTNSAYFKVRFPLAHKFGAGEILEPLALDALGHPLYADDQVEWRWDSDGTRHMAAVIRRSSYVERGSCLDVSGKYHPIPVFVKRFRKVHSPEAKS